MWKPTMATSLLPSLMLLLAMSMVRGGGAAAAGGSPSWCVCRPNESDAPPWRILQARKRARTRHQLQTTAPKQARRRPAKRRHGACASRACPTRRCGGRWTIRVRPRRRLWRAAARRAVPRSQHAARALLVRRQQLPPIQGECRLRLRRHRRPFLHGPK
jgi:hypothetical protein